MWQVTENKNEREIKREKVQMKPPIITTLSFSCAFVFNFRKPEPGRITKRIGRYFRPTEWKIRINRKKENLKTEKATLLDGSCCWTITGSQRQEILLNSRNPVAQLDFYVKKVKPHKCSGF